MPSLLALYDADCGFCAAMLALLLAIDRDRVVEPVPIQSERGRELLADLEPDERLASWHLVDSSGARHSGGDGIPVMFAALPHGRPLSWLTARLPAVTSRVYSWV